MRYDTQFIILVEMHMSGDRSRSIVKKKKGFDRACVSDAQGNYGGMWCL